MSGIHIRTWEWVCGGLVVCGLAALVAGLLLQPEPLSPPAAPAVTSSTAPTTTTTPAGTAQVVRVIDGDTIVVREAGAQVEAKVRFIGIDTPEIEQDPTKSECFGGEAVDWLREQLPAGTPVQLVADPTQDNQDRYGRLLRYVWVDQTQDVGWLLVIRGYAHEYTYDDPYELQPDYRQAQSHAQAQPAGGWRAAPEGGCGWTP